MAANNQQNAPYYRAGQVTTTSSSTNAAQPRFVPDEDRYELAESAGVASPYEHSQSSEYTEPVAPQTSTEHNLEKTHNFVELLEAATTAAAGQAVQAQGMSNAVATDTSATDHGKRKSVSKSPTNVAASARDTSGSKRRRVDLPTDPTPLVHDYGLRDTSQSDIVPSPRESTPYDARAVGVHSAAVLFRPLPESSTRKYTRPPMSKLFISLQLIPENFLQLQACAKAYMLDSRHQERQKCVGNRGKGDTDMVKLRLFNCVRDFLSDEVGERFFGEHVEKPGQTEASDAARALGEQGVLSPEGRLTWPRDGNRIVSLVTPLMRRMVTNERQRQYAVEIRKGGTKRSKEKSVEASPPSMPSRLQEDEQMLQSTFDPDLAQNHLNAQRPNLSAYSKHTTREHDTLGVAEAVNPDSRIQRAPTMSQVVPKLSHINIFLVVASQGSKTSTKLDEKRITAEPPNHLTFYDWNEFLKEVNKLLTRTKATHPNLRQKVVFQDDSVGAESLRGLAAAANALQLQIPSSESAALRRTTMPDGGPSSAKHASKTIDTPARQEHSSIVEVPPCDKVASATAFFSTNITSVLTMDDDVVARLPFRPVIKSIGPDGWRYIHDEKDWYDVLREKAFAVWADGVCNVLVELAGASASVPASKLDES